MPWRDIPYGDLANFSHPNILETLRIKSLQSQNAFVYYKLCNDLGISEPEDPYLYEMGQADYQWLEQGNISQSQLERKLISLPEFSEKCPMEVYQNFVKEVKDNGVPTDIHQWPNYKSGILRKYFPNAFSKKRDLNHMTPAQIGTAFQRTLNYAKKTLEKSKVLV